MGIEVSTSVRVIEIDGEEQRGLNRPSIGLRSHGIYNGVTNALVVIELPDGSSYTVPLRDLINAAERCMDC